jgi:phosphopantothenoylcysteine decarboxylase
MSTLPRIGVHRPSDSSRTSRRRRRVLLGVTGSVAAVKVPEIAVRLVEEVGNLQVTIVLTRGGLTFWNQAQAYNLHYWNRLQCYLGRAPSEDGTTDRNEISVLDSEDEWRSWKTLGDPVLHIELREWADVLLLCPLSAHTLAKISHGLCDDVLSSIVRAWDWGYHATRPPKPILVAPAMNTAMWTHPLTAQQLQTVQSFYNASRYPEKGVLLIDPQTKELACGEVGNGALAAVETILSAVREALCA